MFITAVCVIFLIKLRWPKNKSFYRLYFLIVFQAIVARQASHSGDSSRQQPKRKIWMELLTAENWSTQKLLVYYM